MAQENSVLIVSDRPRQAALLARAVEHVLTCHCIAPHGTLPADLPLVTVVDVTQDDGVAAAWVARLHGLRIPTLHLSDRPVPGAVRTLPSDTLRTVVLAALFGLIEARRAALFPQAPSAPSASESGGAARQAPASRNSLRPGSRKKVAALAEVAKGIVTDLFEAARSGAPLSIDAVEAGTEVILDAVSDGGIRAWLDIIAGYDPQLYQHSLSVAGYAAAFGAGLRFGRADQRRVACAALLHDVGKTRIPLAILNKPGRLTPAEMAVMRTHPALGADLLARDGGFDAATLQVVRHHHEMLDGSGYPDGLAGAAVPDLVRLVTICDIHSALTERRAYREPMPHAEAHGLMRAMGPKLDADLLRAFGALMLPAMDATPVA